jgi:hypothetical protein
VKAAKETELFVKLPVMVRVFATVSLYTAPELTKTSPLNLFARILVVKFIVPDIFVVPFMVRTREHVSNPPAIIDSEPIVKVVLLVVAVRVPPLFTVTEPV